MLVASVAARPCESRLQGASERTSACVICGARSLALAISVSEGTPTQPRPHNLGSSLRCVSCSFSERNTEPRALRLSRWRSSRRAQRKNAAAQNAPCNLARHHHRCTTASTPISHHFALLFTNTRFPSRLPVTFTDAALRAPSLVSMRCCHRRKFRRISSQLKSHQPSPRARTLLSRT